MKLSEAMLLGSVTGQAEPGDWCTCALGISADMAGLRRPGYFCLFGVVISTNQRPASILKEWPWLASSAVNGPALTGFSHMTFLWQISDRFEDEEWSMTQLAEWIKTVEPDCGKCNRYDCTCAAVPVAPAVAELTR